MSEIASGIGRLWLFDIDGTLVAPSDEQFRSWLATFREVFGLEPSPETITAHLGQTFVEIVGGVVRAHGGPDPSPRLREALAAYTRHVRNSLSARPARLLPGAPELLAFLKRQGNLVGVVTGNFPDEGEAKLVAVGLRSLIDLVVYADLDTPARESLVRQALTAARRLGFRGEFADTVVVGDSVHDIAAARRTGAAAIAVGTGVTPREALTAAGPDLLVSDLLALLSIVRQMGARWIPSTRTV